MTANNHAFYENLATNLNKNYVIPDGRLFFNYRFTKSKALYFNYERWFSIPENFQIMPVENLDNPLVTRTGNPDLKASTSDAIYFSFSDYDWQSRSGYFIYGNLIFNHNQIISASKYNTAGQQIITYDNVDGTYSASFGSEWSKSIKKEANTFGFRFGGRVNYNLDKGFTNGELYDAKMLKLIPYVQLSYDYGEILNLKPSYEFSFNDTRYNNSSIRSTSNTTHNFKVELTNFFYKKWVLGNDFGYTYNSNLSGPYKKDFYLWNTSLSYKFSGDKFTFKAKVYDLLNQNQSTSRNITATSVVDSENTVLKRYVMFSLMYKFQNFAVKKKD